MTLAHFKPMTKAGWLAVKQERLMLDMPLGISWENMDNRMLSRFFERHSTKRDGLFQCASRNIVSSGVPAAAVACSGSASGHCPDENPSWCPQFRTKCAGTPTESCFSTAGWAWFGRRTSFWHRRLICL